MMISTESRRPSAAWRELSAMIRFGRANGRCEACRRPHAHLVYHVGDGRWWDEEAGCWRNSEGQRLRWRAIANAGPLRLSRVVIACARINRSGADEPDNLMALCRRCLMLRRAPEYRQQHRLTLLKRRALGDLFLGVYPSRPAAKAEVS